jgi:hypothetical protein
VSSLLTFVHALYYKDRNWSGDELIRFWMGWKWKVHVAAFERQERSQECDQGNQRMSIPMMSGLGRVIHGLPIVNMHCFGSACGLHVSCCPACSCKIRSELAEIFGRRNDCWAVRVGRSRTWKDMHNCEPCRVMASPHHLWFSYDHDACIWNFNILL